MLDEFIGANRGAIVARAQERACARTTPNEIAGDPAHGVAVLLEQLGDALRMAKSTAEVDHEQLSRTAGRHGQNLLSLGLSVGQVVHGYGDVCQAITELATEQQALIPADEFRTLNLCLDDAIASAVTEYGSLREEAIEDAGNERVGVLAHEVRNYLNTAALSFALIKSGRVAVNGSTGALHERSLTGLRDLIDRSLTDVRVNNRAKHLERISVGDFIEEVGIGAQMQAEARGVKFAASCPESTVTIEGDRQSLAGALANLLQNAVKFTPAHGAVILTTRVTPDRVFFDVEDGCGGLPPGKTEELFLPFKQGGEDRSGVGLGLSISLEAAKANDGELSVRDLPGKGCIFTLELPRKLEQS